MNTGSRAWRVTTGQMLDFTTRPDGAGDISAARVSNWSRFLYNKIN